MLNNLLKLSALVITGRFLKPRFKGLLILIVFWLLVRLLHAEYISYVQLSADTSYLWQAALIKITLYIVGFCAYFMIVERRILLHSKLEQEEQKNQLLLAGEDDGFNFLRAKKKLSSKSEQLLRK
tara:strand:+ start:1863 stop:2237 length:375 start_codon:yes stop_codon:yes gene_type:complete